MRSIAPEVEDPSTGAGDAKAWRQDDEPMRQQPRPPLSDLWEFENLKKMVAVSNFQIPREIQFENLGETVNLTI